jgi:hypothetical protein
MKNLFLVAVVLLIAPLMMSGCTAKQAMLNKKLAVEIEDRIRQDSDLNDLLDEIKWERGVLQFYCKKDSGVGMTGAYAMARRLVEDYMLPVHEEADSHPGTLRADVVAFEADAVEQVSGTGEYKTLASATYDIEKDEWDQKRYGMSGY